MLDFSILTENLDMYLLGFKNTIMSSLIALVSSLILGVLIAIMRIAPIKPLNWLGTAYVEFIRNIPLLIITFFFFLGLKLSGLYARDISLDHLHFIFHS